MTRYLVRVFSFDARSATPQIESIFASPSDLGFRRFGRVLACTLAAMDEMNIPLSKLDVYLANRGQVCSKVRIEPGFDRRFDRRFGDFCFDVVVDKYHPDVGTEFARRDIFMRTAIGNVVWRGQTPNELALFCSELPCP